MIDGDRFAAALAYTLPHEMGYVDDPADSGGPTNYGITQATLAAWRGCPVTASDVKALTRDEASLIFYKKYWKYLRLDLVCTPPVALAIFDAAVLFGVGTSALAAQKALRGLGGDLALDGHIGTATTEALNAAAPAAFLQTFAGVLTSRIITTVAARPKDSRFERGWESRVDRYLLLA